MLRLSETSWSDIDFSAVHACLDADELSMGTRVQEFESQFADYVGSKHAVMVNSGSSANLLGANVLSEYSPVEGQRNVVIVPALSWSTTYFPWIQQGYRLKFIDISRDTFNIDLAALAEEITPEVVGICVPHILGADAGILEIQKLAVDHGLWLLEDTCESLGNRPVAENKKLLGAYGTIGTFSFFRSHHISTMEGGMLVTDNTDIFHLAKSIRAHGWARDLPEVSIVGVLDKDPWQRKFKFYVPGFNLRPLEMSGAVGLTQLAQLDSFLENRRENARLLQDQLRDVPGVNLQAQGDNGSWMAFGMTLDPDTLPRKAVVSALEEIGVETRPVVTGNFLKQPVMSKINEQCIVSGTFDDADYVHDNGLMFANHGRDLSSELSQVVEVISNLL